MSTGARGLIFLIGLTIFLLTFELVRRRRFREELSILWFIVGILVACGAYADIIINPLAKLLNIGYPPILIIVFMIIILITTVICFSIVTSDLKGKVKELNQKIAFIEYELNKEMKKTREGGK